MGWPPPLNIIGSNRKEDTEGRVRCPKVYLYQYAYNILKYELIRCS